MEFSWVAALSQLIIIGLIILFIVSLYKFVKRMISHTVSTRESLKRIEEKVDLLMKLDDQSD